ncbi:ATP-binding cassette domain-containing protein [Rhodococcus sp. X156]|uniref:ATP-binding cassette domain-containing protein n=1 Tax=Rhodococcus sp. X156 TaxID=2499145 RepID=UPI000FDACF1E|nr:ATP-binding cassette domain-containing protein [Rhodococcus sp. X156]
MTRTATTTGVQELAVQAEGLVKIYRGRRGGVRALDGVDLEVPTGTVLGLLGPNGAGKTTVVRILTTLLRPDSGTAQVAGLDVVRQANEVRSKIGLSGQYAAVDEHLTGLENLRMVGQLYGMPTRQATARARELLTDFRLEEAADRPAKTYSGGMRRRLDLAGALVARPPVVVLDEPTTGLDPRGRLDMWAVITGLVADGTTVLLTTQYLEEADQLAHSIAVIDKGKVIARGTADQLKNEVGGERLQIELASAEDQPKALEVLAGLGSGEPAVDADTGHLGVTVDGGSATLVRVLRELDAIGITVLDVALNRPTLDDVFLSLTGHATDTTEGAPQ